VSAETLNQEIADKAAHQKHLTDQAKSNCYKLLSNPDRHIQSCSILTIMLGSHLSKEDKAWSLAICRKQLRSTSSHDSIIWKIAYETITGQFLTGSQL
jgi:hypothetical protein